MRFPGNPPSAVRAAGTFAGTAGAGGISGNSTSPEGILLILGGSFRGRFSGGFSGAGVSGDAAAAGGR
ncbi:MAG: hypothetical protein LBP93_07100 [Treponema sp.]|nr:hypothetical protein [Treponema sp.]